MEQSNLYGSEKISKILLKLAPPVMLAQLIQALYNIVDSLFVGRYSDSGLTALSIGYEDSDGCTDPGGDHQYYFGSAADLRLVWTAENGYRGRSGSHGSRSGGGSVGGDEKGISKITGKEALSRPSENDLPPGGAQYFDAVGLYLLHFRAEFDPCIFF